MPTAAALPPVRPQVAVVTVAGLLIAAGVVALAITVEGRLAALLVVGGLAGLALHHALFGFASSTRRFLVDRRGAGVRAQAVDRNGGLLQDFSIAETEGAIHVLNAPSPGATSSLSISRYIVDIAKESFDLDG